jgi:hypothetical protein
VPSAWPTSPTSPCPPRYCIWNPDPRPGEPPLPCLPLCNAPPRPEVPERAMRRAGQVISQPSRRAAGPCHAASGIMSPSYLILV